MLCRSLYRKIGYLDSKDSTSQATSLLLVRCMLISLIALKVVIYRIPYFALWTCHASDDLNCWLLRFLDRHLASYISATIPTSIPNYESKFSQIATQYFFHAAFFLSTHCQQNPSFSQGAAIRACSPHTGSYIYLPNIPDVCTNFVCA